LVQKLHPDVVLMDVSMPELNGIEACRQIHKAYPEIRVVMLSMYADRQYIFESLRAGACGYVWKNNATLAELLQAIETVQTGETYLSPSLRELVMNDYVRWARGELANTVLEKLSGREREVLQLIAEG